MLLYKVNMEKYPSKFFSILLNLEMYSIVTHKVAINLVKIRIHQR